MTEVRKQYAREYRERRRLFNIVQVWRGGTVTAPFVCSDIAIHGKALRKVD